MDTRDKAQEVRTVLITGGAGYVGSALVPQLLCDGYKVKVVDLFWFGRDVFGDFANHPGLTLLELDIRDRARVREAMKGCWAVIHLACISNDPSYELDPMLSKTINYDAFAGVMQGAIDQGVQRFIYASSSSIYGVKDTPDVVEDAEPDPLTDYSKYKLLCERDLFSVDCKGMERVVLRPATVCGYAPRMRLDLTVNILTIHALVNRKIRIFGGRQLRPNIHIQDMVRAYTTFLTAPAEIIDGEAFNVGFQNRSVEDIAAIVRDTLDDPGISLEYVPTEDHRSYHVNSDKVKRVLGFEPIHTIEDAVRDIAVAFHGGKIPDPLTQTRYSNIKTMQTLWAK